MAFLLKLAPVVLAIAVFMAVLFTSSCGGGGIAAPVVKLFTCAQR